MDIIFWRAKHPHEDSGTLSTSDPYLETSAFKANPRGSLTTLRFLKERRLLCPFPPLPAQLSSKIYVINKGQKWCHVISNKGLDRFLTFNIARDRRLLFEVRRTSSLCYVSKAKYTWHSLLICIANNSLKCNQVPAGLTLDNCCVTTSHYLTNWRIYPQSRIQSFFRSIF